MDQQQLDLRKDGGVATITFNRPESRNSLSSGLLEDFSKALEDCMAEDVRAVVIRGSGNSFCSGADCGTLPRPWRRVRRSCLPV